MKKYIKLTLMLLGLVIFSSCSKEEIPMTSTVNVAGEWMVTIDVIDGEDVYEDWFGPMLWITYNTNADNGKEIWINSLNPKLNAFWFNAIAKIPCDTEALTFGSDSPVVNTFYEDATVTVSGGKITLNEDLSPSGMPVDKFECTLTFSNDQYGYTYYVHGHRRTGFAADGED